MSEHKKFIGDNVEVLSDLDICPDLIFIDPPYGVDYKTNYRTKDVKFTDAIPNDSDLSALNDVLPLLFDKLKDDGWFVCFMGERYLCEAKKLISDVGFVFKRMIVWDKCNWTAGDLTGNFSDQLEYLLLFAKGKPKLTNGRPQNLISINRVSGKKQIHQNQKPVDLLIKIINHTTKEGDLVLDCFSGSDSLAMACKKIGRSSVCIDVVDYDKVVRGNNSSLEDFI
jgi:site-specific DNA-methyltransferase (adenine-specific)